MIRVWVLTDEDRHAGITEPTELDLRKPMPSLGLRKLQEVSEKLCGRLVEGECPCGWGRLAGTNDGYGWCHVCSRSWRVEVTPET